MPETDLRSLRSRLTPAQQALLEKRLRKAQGGQAKEGTIPRHDYDGTAPLSYGQRWFWFCFKHWSRSAPSPIYILPTALRLKGPLDIVALERAINEVIRRHEAIRTTFPVVNGVRVQEVAKHLTLHLPVIDLRALPETKREDLARHLTSVEARRLFYVERGPFIRISLLKLGDDDHILLLTMHHIITDGWSLAIMTQEIATIYGAYSKGKPSPLPELTIQYADYAIWHDEWLQGEILEKLLDYWKRQLAGVPLVLELPADKPRPQVQTSRGAKHSLVLSSSLAEALRELSRHEGVTLFMTLLAAFNVLLHKYTGREDILVGSPIAGRNRPELESLIGYFANNLALRTNLAGDPSGVELLARVRDVVLGAFAHQDMPFLKLVEMMQSGEDCSRAPVIQVLFVLENTPPPTLEASDLSLMFLSTGTGTATRDISFFVFEEGEELRLVLVYNADLFEPTTIERMLGAYKSILERLVVNPQQSLSALCAGLDAG